MSETTQERLDRLESRLAEQQTTIERQRERIDDLEAGESTDDVNVTDGLGVSRRDALKAGGLLALLFGGVGTASATSTTPQGQVGTPTRPLTALYTEALDGGLTDDQRVESLLGNGLFIEDNTLTTAVEVPELSVTDFTVSQKATQETFTVDATVKETYGVKTNGLTVTLTVVNASGKTVYNAAYSPNELKSDSTAVTFGSDGSTTKLGPLDTGSYTATVTADASNTAPASATDGFSVTNPFAGTAGTTADPHQIDTWSKLDLVRYIPSKSFVLTADLDPNTAGYADVASGSANGGRGFDPIGDSSTGFTGSFDGDGHTITGVTIDRGNEDKVGLFGYADLATISDLGLEALDVTGAEGVGGLVGNCGIVSIDRSYTTGSVTGSFAVGGVAGYVTDGTIKRSYSSAAVNRDAKDIGGLVGGVDRATIKDSYATGSVSGTGNVGGLVGNSHFGTVKRSYATGRVTGSGSDVGGLIGLNGLRADQISTYDPYLYWDTDSTGQSSSDGGTGLPTAKMQGAAAKSNMTGFDFSSDGTWATVDASNADVSNDGYPVLRALDRATQLAVRS